jgi:hypothetical protein
MIVQFETYSEDGTAALESVEMPCVPRKGETVTLRGPLYGGMRRQTSGEGYTMFKVHGVSYDLDVADGKTDVAITVYLKIHGQDEQVRFFQARCICSEDNRSVDDRNPETCGHCGDLAWWKKP